MTNNASLSPTQSVLLATSTATGASTFFTAGHALAAGAPSAATRYLTAQASVFVQSVAGDDRYFGVGFGTSALATSGFAGIALGGNGLRGGAGSYASYNGVTGGLLQARTKADFLGRWVTLQMVADRSLTTNNVTFTFSGLGTSGGSATQTFTTSANFGTTNLTSAQIFCDWGSTSSVQGSAFVDNASFNASASPVPEPSAFAALGLAALALVRRRRK